METKSNLTEEQYLEMKRREARKLAKEKEYEKLRKIHYTVFAIVGLIVISLIISVIANIVISSENTKLKNELESKIIVDTTSSTVSTNYPATSSTPHTTEVPQNTSANIQTTPVTDEIPSPVHTIEEILNEKYASVFNYQQWAGQDFTIDRMKYLYDKCEEYQISMEFVMSIYCTESSFKSQAKNKNSSATGYGQIVSGTAEWVYENLLKLGDYDKDNHVEIIKGDWKLSIDLTTKLIDWLYNRYGNYTETAMHYYGSTSEASNRSYADIVNTKCETLFNLEIANLTDTPIHN